MDSTSPATLASPLTLQDLSATEDEGGSLAGSPTVGHALAGPMSLVKAQVMHKEWRRGDREWRSALTDSVERSSSIKRSDPDRGLERVGRQLAHSINVRWTEYWDFLECYADLATGEGLQRLEDHLSKMAAATIPLATPISLIETSPVLRGGTFGPGVALRSLDIGGGTGASLSRALFGDASKETASNGHDAEPQPIDMSMDKLLDDQLAMTEVDVIGTSYHSSDNIDDDKSCDELTREMDNLESQYKTPPHDSTSKMADIFITGACPSKLDRDVYLALGDVTVDPHTHPHVFQWMHLVISYSTQDQKRADGNVRSSPLIVCSPSSHSPSLHTHSPSLRTHSPSHPPLRTLTPLRHRGHQTTPTRLLHATPTAL